MPVYIRYERQLNVSKLESFNIHEARPGKWRNRVAERNKKYLETFNRLCMKLFKTGSIDAVTDCQSYFAIDLPRRQD